MERTWRRVISTARIYLVRSSESQLISPTPHWTWWRVVPTIAPFAAPSSRAYRPRSPPPHWTFMLSHIYHSTHLSCGFIGESAAQPHASLNSFILDTGLMTRSRSGLWPSDENSSPAWHHSCTQNIQWSHRTPSGLMLLQVTNNERLLGLFWELQVGKVTYLNIFWHLRSFSYRIRRSAVGWGTALQVGRLRVRFPMVSLEFFINIILPAAVWPWGRLSL